MFKKILIANRGEIACRIIKTARRLGIASVAIYSDVDANALHVRMADEAIGIGRAAPEHSYLNIPGIIAACKQAGVDGVHPGYGFLSENAQFAKALIDAGIVFIGPPVAAITAMGDKITAKRIAEQAGVPTIPGGADRLRDADHAVTVAAEVGYPVMLKASAGGGGKGMRIATDDSSCRDGFERARSEARTSFGDDRLLLEKYIEEPRHIEIQVLADLHGTVLHLFERECSIQRRHQKVVEESPSPLLDAATRQAMGEQAVALARAVNYVSAGTVEFIVDKDRRFYFLEMNTRLQVEHPVTELVTGLDLVEWMLIIAAGEPLLLQQSDLHLRGWAIEGRVYAESPERDFLPSTGRVTDYIEPPLSSSVRMDTSIYAGSEVSVYYDPMIAKLITFGATREHAIERMQTALDACYIRGVETNINFLSALMAHKRFRSGHLTTHFIAEEYADGFGPEHKIPAEPSLFAAIATAIHYRCQLQIRRISGQMEGCQPPIETQWIAQIDSDHWLCTVAPTEDGQRIDCAGKPYVVTSDWQPNQPLFSAAVNGISRHFRIERKNSGYRLWHNGSEASVLLLTPRQAALHALMPVRPPPDHSRWLLSPMPGLLIEILVAVGDRVKAGQKLAVVEAMKMENVLRASQDQVIRAVPVQVGDRLAVDQAVIEFE